MAEFGLLLTESDYMGDANFQRIIENARSGRGEDEHGYRAEFIRLVQTAESLSATLAANRWNSNNPTFKIGAEIHWVWISAPSSTPPP